MSLAFRRVPACGTKVGYGHVADRAGHYWGEIGLPAYPDSPQGRELRDLRVRLGLSLRQACAALGLSAVDCSLLERGGAECDWEEAARRLREAKP